jgi:ribonuclease P protein component
MNLPPLALERLKKRADFLRATRGVRRVWPSVTLEVCATPPLWDKPGRLRVGFTATKKLGIAVVRNRAKRRLKAAAARLLPLYGLAGNDYVLVARQETLSRPFEGLLADLASALQAAHRKLGRSNPGDAQ